MKEGFVEFEFDLPEALLSSLVEVFGAMAAAPLISENVNEVPEAQGVYQLLLADEVVYIGKTDAEAGLRKRLERHARTIQHRHNLNPNSVKFKAVRVYVFTAMDLEAQLIRHYSVTGQLPWNNSGFGSNDPGRERDTTNIKPEGFDSLYPIDIDRQVELLSLNNTSAADVLNALRGALPYTLRVQTAARGSRRPHPELVAAQVNISSEISTTRQIIEAVLKSIPAGWQATALAGRIIMYREATEYPFGVLIGRS